MCSQSKRGEILSISVYTPPPEKANEEKVVVCEHHPNSFELAQNVGALKISAVPIEHTF